MLSAYNLKKGVRCPSGLVHTHSDRELIASATHHGICVNLHILPWNWRNLLKSLPMKPLLKRKFYDK